MAGGDPPRAADWSERAVLHRFSAEGSDRRERGRRGGGNVDRFLRAVSGAIDEGGEWRGADGLPDTGRGVERVVRSD